MLKTVQRRKFDPKEDFSKNPYIATEGLKVWREMQEQAQRNGLSEMTLEEINAEIYAARREREAREAQGLQ